MRRAGATSEMAKRVADRVQPYEGIATDLLRKRVADEIRREQPPIADAYLRTVRLKARAAADVPSGRVRIPDALPRVPDLGPITNARVGFGDKWAQVAVERSLRTREVLMNQADLQRLGATEGARVAVHFPPETPPVVQSPGRPA